MVHAFTLSHELYLPRELVFEVWVDSAHLDGWYPAPEETLLSGAAAGAWRLLDAAGGLVEEVRARAVRPPEALEWEVSASGEARTLAVTFGGGHGTCTVSVVEGGFAAAAERDRQEEVWRRRLQRLEEYFAAI